MVNEKDIKMAAHSIYFKNADKPKETVIARGKVVYHEDWSYGESCGDNVYIGDADILSELFDYAGKTIEIIIREVSDE